LQVHFCIFTSLHMLNFHVFILACTTKLQNYKHINFQFAAIAGYKWQNYNLGYRPVTKFASLQNQNIYKLLINNYKFTIWQIATACLQVYKFASMQNYKITKLPITKYKITKLQIAKLHVHVCKSQIYKIKSFSI